MSPNWCSGDVHLEGTKEQIIEFCKLFVFEDDDENVNDRRFFARSFANETWKDYYNIYLKNLASEDSVDVPVDFAWSAFSCLIEGYPQEFKDCMTLKEAIKKTGIKSVEITTTEPGMAFEEQINYDSVKDGSVIETKAYSMGTLKCKDCGECSPLMENCDDSRICQGCESDNVELMENKELDSEENISMED